MNLSATVRSLVGKKVKSIRASGLVPAVVYGHGIEGTLNITFNKNEFLKIYREVEKAQPFTLVVDGRSMLVLVHDFQVHAVYSHLLHVDLLALNPKQKAHSHVPVHLVGESPVQKNNLGRIQLLHADLNVEAMPQDLPKEIVIDISSITNINQVIHVSDLPTSSKYVITDPADMVILTVVEIDDGSDEEGPSEEQQSAG
ncbi:MAG: 50S ribosomal protein L25 [Candidatus Absconditabacterales bacterium]|nr:50S ribosomal protein L25 [Candidatus Absconditabacterales bacterium]